MTFNTSAFLLFFPIVVCLYFIIPDRYKNYFLLAASYYFYMSWNAKYALLILAITLVTYVGAILISDKKSKITMAFCILFSFGVLFWFKYTNFFLGLVGWFMEKVGVQISVPVFDIVLPVGISFYTFQAVGYLIDVYRGETEAERNIFKYALFVSFFPQLVAGPIERSGNLLKQLIPHKFDYERFRQGFMLMLWGYFLKLVLADRIAIFVDTVYGDYLTYSGVYVIVATILFGIQIYCDFMGYTVIAVGAARILGVDLTDNFKAPYLSTNVADFWRKWHISLTSWFRDYLYFPLGGSRKGRLRKSINIMIVFLVSGLWHGANLAYVLWGAINGLYQVVGELLMPVRRKIRELLHISTDKIGYRLIGTVITFAMVDFAWLFFRAGTLRDSKGLLKSMIGTYNPWVLFDGTSIYACGLDKANMSILLIAIFVLLVADYCKGRGIIIRDVILRQDYWFKLLFVPFAIGIILLFGVYGPGYDDTAFIYFRF